MQQNLESIELISKQRAYAGYFGIDRYRLRYPKFNGGMSATLTREVLERGHVGAVLPVDPTRDEVLLIEQFRPGPYAAGSQPWSIECVAGVIEAGEQPQDVAVRESQEEAGCAIHALHPIAKFFSSPGASSETVHLFCGKTDTTSAGGIFGLETEGEDIRVHVVAVNTAIAWLDEGKINNAKTIIALQWLARHYDWLKDYWSANQDSHR